MSNARLLVRLRGMFDISAPSRVSHSTINTRFTAIESSHVELRLPYRRRLTNHLGAIHALHRQGLQ